MQHLIILCDWDIHLLCLVFKFDISITTWSLSVIIRHIAFFITVWVFLSVIHMLYMLLALWTWLTSFSFLYHISSNFLPSGVTDIVYDLSQELFISLWICFGDWTEHQDLGCSLSIAVHFKLSRLVSQAERLDIRGLSDGVRTYCWGQGGG